MLWWHLSCCNHEFPIFPIFPSTLVPFWLIRNQNETWLFELKLVMKVYDCSWTLVELILVIKRSRLIFGSVGSGRVRSGQIVGQIFAHIIAFMLPIWLIWPYFTHPTSGLGQYKWKHILCKILVSERQSLSDNWKYSDCDWNIFVVNKFNWTLST